MNKQSYLALIVFAALLILALFVVNYMSTVIKGSTEVACTMEARVCPDGSAVGRTGPNCEFAPCPEPVQATGPSTIQARIGEQISALDVSITPTQVVSDSRCPAGVQCIWAGTVELKVHIVSGMGESDTTLTLGKPFTTESEEITLTDVSPAKNEGDTIAGSSYLFTFLVKKI